MSQLVSRWMVAVAAVLFVALEAAEVQAQAPSPNLNATQRRAERRRLRGEALRSGETDQAAGEFIDSIFADTAPSDPLISRRRNTTALDGKQSIAARTAPWRGQLVHNPDTTDGSPPYALLDRYGKIKRYVESSEGVDLDQHLGETVTVRRDTGTTLLASQLILSGGGGATDEIDNALQLAQYEQVMVPQSDALYLDGPVDGLDFGMPTGGCVGCGDPVCSKPGCGFGSRPIFYARGEYLQWWLEGMNTPPLVIQDAQPDTVSDPDVEFLQPGVSIIYGDNRILEEGRDGYRVTLGYWFDDYGNWGIEGDYLDLGGISESFSAGQLDGIVPANRIGRPFIAVAPLDANNDGDTDDLGELPVGRAAEEVDTEDLDGRVTVNSRSDFQTSGVRFMHGLCCRENCGVGCGDCVGGCDSCTSCGTGVGGNAGWLPGVRRTDFIWGLRWAELDEGLQVTEDLQERDDLDTFLLNDIFDTNNQFTGAEVGFRWQWEHQRWSLDMLSKIAIGNTEQSVRINGSTLVNRGTAFEATNPGGLLALPSNIGIYERDQFSIMPELGAKLGYMMTDRLRLSVGYTFLYWSNVVRPGDQISLLVDPNQVARFGGGDAGFAPEFRFIETGIWAQGLDFGAEYRW